MINTQRSIGAAFPTAPNQGRLLKTILRAYLRITPERSRQAIAAKLAKIGEAVKELVDRRSSQNGRLVNRGQGPLEFQ